MFFLVLIRELCVTEVSLDCTLSAVVFDAAFSNLILYLIKSIMTTINPIRQINKATPRQTAERRADLFSELPIIIENMQYSLQRMIQNILN